LKPRKDFTEDTAQRILSRAVELDAADGGRLSRSQLEGVARELGLATDAVDRAIEEVERGRVRTSGPMADGRTGWWLPLMSLGIGGVAGALVDLWTRSDPDVGILTALGAVGLGCLALIARYRSRRHGWLLQGTLLALWTGLGLGLTVIDRAPFLDIWSMCGVGWAISAASALFIGLVNQLYSPDPPAGER
jgi:hypothetical protein